MSDIKGELTTGHVKGSKITAPKFDAKTGDVKQPSMVVVTFEFPNTPATAQKIAKLARDSFPVDVLMEQQQIEMEFDADKPLAGVQAG